ncbi:MAG: type IV toxin-antitoxin system AbiEi family antitoxin domain-containing protein [Eubacteriales bacterium]
MTKTDLIMEMAMNNNGIVTTEMVVKAGVSRGNLKYLVDKGRLEQATRGVYTLPEVWEDEFINLQNRFKRGVYSHETALFIHDLTDRTPNAYHMTFPSTYNLTKVKRENVRCSQVGAQLHDLGIEEAVSPAGNKIYVYCIERTLCDILIPRNQTDIQVVSEAFKRYVKRKDRDIMRLSEYAKRLKVEEKVRTYLEVLL